MILLRNNQPEELPVFSENRFRSGYNLYEVFRVFRGKVIFAEDNLSRLDSSIRKSNWNLSCEALGVPEKLERLIRLEQIREGNIKYVLHKAGDTIDEYLYQITFHYPSGQDYRDGVPVITLPAVREHAEIKYLNYELRDETDLLIRQHKVYEVLLYNEERQLTEGSRSNLFFIRDNTLYTAPLPYVLPGTSRKRVLEVCRQQAIPFREVFVTLDELPRMEAAFLTGTSPLVLPINRIDRTPFDPAHPLLREVMELYFAFLTSFL